MYFSFYILQPTPKGVKPDAKYGLNGRYFEPAYYVVGAGDSLPKIAKWATDHFGRTITAEQLAEQNGIVKTAEGAFLIHPEQSVRFKIFDF